MQVFYADTPSAARILIAQQMIKDGQRKIDDAENMDLQNDKAIAAGGRRRYRESHVALARSVGQELRVRGHYLLHHTEILPEGTKPTTPAFPPPAA